MAQLLQIAGAALILIAFLLAQAGRLDQHSYPYLLLEGAWSLVSLWSIGRRLCARRNGRLSAGRAADGGSRSPAGPPSRR